MNSRVRMDVCIWRERYACVRIVHTKICVRICGEKKIDLAAWTIYGISARIFLARDLLRNSNNQDENANLVNDQLIHKWLALSHSRRTRQMEAGRVENARKFFHHNSQGNLTFQIHTHVLLDGRHYRAHIQLNT